MRPRLSKRVTIVPCSIVYLSFLRICVRSQNYALNVNDIGYHLDLRLF